MLRHHVLPIFLCPPLFPSYNFRAQVRKVEASALYPVDPFATPEGGPLSHQESGDFQLTPVAELERSERVELVDGIPEVPFHSYPSPVPASSSPTSDLLVMIPSHVSEQDKRCAVRNGWMRMIGSPHCTQCGEKKVKAVFVVGSGMSKEEEERVRKEEEAFGDVLVLKEFKEDGYYKHRSTKTRMAMRAVFENFSFRLLLKCDTDSFVFLDRLLKFLDEKRAWEKPRLYAGSFNRGRNAPVFNQDSEKSSPYYDLHFTLQTGLSVYPLHGKGAGYILSSQLVGYLAHPPVPLAEFTCEDTSIGAYLMAVEHEKLNMEVFMVEPDCRCSGLCLEGVEPFYKGRVPLIDHYVPQWLMRTRGRRWDLFGDPCFSEVDREAFYKHVESGGGGEGGTRVPTCPAPQKVGRKVRAADILSIEKVKGRWRERGGGADRVCGLTYSSRIEKVEGDEECKVCEGSDGFKYDLFECGY